MSACSGSYVHLKFLPEQILKTVADSVSPLEACKTFCIAFDTKIHNHANTVSAYLKPWLLIYLLFLYPFKFFGVSCIYVYLNSTKK